MDKQIDQLKMHVLLTHDDIFTMRSDVANTYPKMSPSERTFIFANKVRFQLNKHYLGVHEDHVKHLTTHVLSKTLARHIYEVNKHDLWQSICDYDTTPESKLNIAKDWLEHSANIRLSEQRLAAALHLKAEKRLRPPLLVTALCLLILLLAVSGLNSLHGPKNAHIDDPRVSYATYQPHEHPFFYTKESHYFPYERINIFALQSYLDMERQSMLADYETLQTIIHLAYQSNIDALLLFAIIGQEQGFVPNTPTTDARILNNPFNVFHSWQDYNTTLTDSTLIAIRTVKRRLSSYNGQGCPIEWLNGIYAEDPNWHVGVKLIYDKLKSVAGL